MAVNQDWFASWEAGGSLKVGYILGYHGTKADRQRLKYDIWMNLVLFHNGKNQCHANFNGKLVVLGGSPFSIFI